MWFGGEKVGQRKRAKEKGDGSKKGYQGCRQVYGVPRLSPRRG
jgi:hypothetical protein